MDSESIVKRALELGVTFISTAAMQAGGVTEEYLGRALQGSAREKLFIGTKVVKGVDRATILESIEDSLHRLRMENVERIEIIVATVLAFLIFGDTLQSIQVLGGVLILAGIYVLARQRSNGSINS